MTTDEIIKELDKKLVPYINGSKEKFSGEELSAISLKMYGLITSEIASLKNEIKTLKIQSKNK